jgi:bile acid-coenzyme A ligase
MGTLSISRAITLHATERPHDPALTCGDTTLSWLEFDRRTNRLARAFAELGVVAGDLGTIALPNSTAFFESAFALWKLGATPQPVSAKLPGRELEEIVELATHGSWSASTPTASPAAPACRWASSPTRR